MSIADDRAPPGRRGSLERVFSRKQRPRVLGSGAYGVVKAVQLNDGQELVAVKTLKANASPSEMESFQREKQLLQKLDHEHIVGYMGSCGLPGSLGKLETHTDSITMELLEGGSLRSVLGRQMQCSRGRLYSDTDACRWSLQIASALSYLHSLSPQVIFRDLSSANVLLTSSRLDQADAKLIDFGLAKEVPVKRNSQTSLHADGRQLGSSAIPCQASKDARPKLPVLNPDSLDFTALAFTAETGSYLYMCPEVTKHERYDEKCDIFALGCLMYDLFARMLRHVSLFANAPAGAGDAHVLGQYAVKVAGGYRPTLPADIPEELGRLLSQTAGLKSLVTDPLQAKWRLHYSNTWQRRQKNH